MSRVSWAGSLAWWVLACVCCGAAEPARLYVFEDHLTLRPPSIEVSNNFSQSAQIRIANVGGGSLNYSGDQRGLPFWLTTPSLPSGSLASGKSGTIAIAVKSQGLPPGSHHGKIRILAGDAAGSPLEAGVTMIVPGAAVLGAVPLNGNLYKAVAGGGNPGPCTIQISNQGLGQTVNWQVSESAPWLTVNRANGSFTGLTESPTQSPVLSFNIQGLDPGIYRTEVVVSASGVPNSPVRFPIVLSVHPTGTVPPTLEVIQDRLDIAVVAGQEDRVFALCPVANSGGGTLTLAVVADADWLTVLAPPSISTGGSLSVFADTAGLAPGVHNANVALVTNAGIGTVQVSLTVSADLNRPPVLLDGPRNTPSPPRQNQQATFSASATDPDGDALDYTWTFLDGLVLKGSSVTRTTPASGSARLMVSDGHGNFTHATVEYRVAGTGGGAPAIGALKATPSSVRPGSPVMFSYTATDPETPNYGLGATIDFGDGHGASGSGNWNFYHAYAAPGVYTARVTVSDGTSTASASVAVTVLAVSDPLNTRPTVLARGPNAVTLPNRLASGGAVLDDGRPVPPGRVTLQWSKLTGPGSVTFGNASMADTTAAFSAAGDYVLRLHGSDGDLDGYGLLSVKVAAASNSNVAPFVFAGSTLAADANGRANLSGTVSDDGKPVPPGQLTLAWRKISGPGAVSFSSASAANTQVQLAAPGVYILELSAFDGSLTSSDYVSIVFASTGGNQAPVVESLPWASPNPVPLSP